MKKAAKKQPKRMPHVPYWVAASLLLLCLILLFAVVHQSSTDPEAAVRKPSISLGAMQYDFSNGKAVTRTDAATTKLSAFLHDEAARSGCSKSAPAFEHVVAFSTDETQVLLKYGCGAADSPMYAVQTDGVWHSLSPSNQFDSFEIPNCDYVTAHDISSQIAPVCANGNQTYSVR